MFEPSDRPRVFGMPPGEDFARALVKGLTERLHGSPPSSAARSQIYVNTARMQRRIRDVFDAGPPMLLPRINLIIDLAMSQTGSDMPPAVSPLRRRLELTQVVSALLDKERDLAPRAALYDLTDSLAGLMDEMQGEGVNPARLADLDVSDQSGHWQRALKFLNIIGDFFDTSNTAPDKEARQRLVIERLVRQWAQNAPDHPIIIAGSTGSRGATALLMEAVAKLPQGALILPGFDFDLPLDTWATLDTDPPAQDHPQYRFQNLLAKLNLSPDKVCKWSPDSKCDADRNRLISLSLRPAPVTNQWLEEGPKLGNLENATQGITLVEAPSPRIEAETIALRLRQAAQDGITAALITPDRMLTRQVAAALDRWDIVPDDSAGMPLPLSAPGRFLRHVGKALGETLKAEDLLVILKHPLCHTDDEDRGNHLRHTRELELDLRRNGPPLIGSTAIIDWAQRSGADNPGRIAWADWLGAILDDMAAATDGPLADLIDAHVQLTERLAQGPTGDAGGALWKEAAGREAQRMCDQLRRDADAGGTLDLHDYNNLFAGVLSNGVVRDRDAGHPGVLIWGTLEARVQGADLMILGGMNDGVWPENPAPDPWLNRQMRQKVGLLLPERRIGLSAHDYQQAIGAKEVWITRAKRSTDAETVPSRWVNRLTNLLGGLPENGGPEALSRMRMDGDHWIAQATALQEPKATVSKATRPSPCPPPEARPKQLSVTRIKTLIRDPFAIYAENVLRLRPLDPLSSDATPLLRGQVFHSVLETFIREKPDVTSPDAIIRFMEIAEAELKANCPWPTVRLQWLTRFRRLAPQFLAQEADRQTKADVVAIETSGAIDIPGPQFRLTGKADRFDQTPNGQIIIYDYKTGQVPTAKMQARFDKQLLIEAAMVERGAFPALGKAPVTHAAFIGVNNDMNVIPAPLDKNPADQVWEDFLKLLRSWMAVDRGYSARLAHFKSDAESPYDHLSRFGEWTMADPIEPVRLT